MSVVTEFVIRDDNGTERTFEERAAAEEAKKDLEELGADVELEAIGTDTTEVVEEPDTTETEPVESLPDQPPSLDEDPISWAPEHFVDTIQGTPAINRKGYAVMAERFGISVVAEPVTLPSNTGFEYAEFRAIAETEDGTEYSGFGSAHVDRQDGDDEHLLGELAETRAMKRALAYATGLGMTAVEELQGEL